MFEKGRLTLNRNNAERMKDRKEQPSGQDCTAAERNYIAGILRKQSAVGGESCRAGFFLMPGKYCMGKYFEFSHITESLGITVHRERYIEF